MDRVTVAVEYVFAFTVLAGLIVLYAAIQATQDERRYEGAVRWACWPAHWPV
jgi:putative ABC transport system permease protein